MKLPFPPSPDATTAKKAPVPGVDDMREYSAKDISRMTTGADRGDFFEVRHMLAVYPSSAGWQDSVGRSALFYAALWGHKDIVILLLERGADPLLADKNGVTPLMACEGNAGGGAYMAETLHAHIRDKRNSHVDAQFEQGSRELPVVRFTGLK